MIMGFYKQGHAGRQQPACAVSTRVQTDLLIDLCLSLVRERGPGLCTHTLLHQRHRLIAAPGEVQKLVQN